jgi:hypothetical protein
MEFPGYPRISLGIHGVVVATKLSKDCIGNHFISMEAMDFNCSQGCLMAHINNNNNNRELGFLIN